MYYDVFNGDADGICALLQLRLHSPQPSRLITGVKRDIKLLTQVASQQDVTGVTVLDISMEKNVDPLFELLKHQIPTFYCDHHRHGKIPHSQYLTALIDLNAEICTSLLINQHLDGAYTKWAVVGAYGDNLLNQAALLADEIGLSQNEKAFLQELGVLLNYNAYGSSLSDLHITPATLFTQLLDYPNPLALKDDFSSPYHRLKQGYQADLAHIESLQATHINEEIRIFELPNEVWARRCSGVLSNKLANQEPNKAHAVLTLNQSEEDYTVSLRAPLSHRTGADEICSSFATGGGRKAAAGINQLPIIRKAEFIQKLGSYYAELRSMLS